MTDVIPTLTSIAAVLFFIFALLSRKRLAETQALLADTSLRFEATQKLGKQSEQQVRGFQEQSERLKQQLTQTERQLEEAQARLNERTTEWGKLKAEREVVMRRADLQKEHLEEQVQVLTSQLAEAVREKKLAQEETQRLLKESDEKAHKQSDMIRNQLREAQQSLQQAKREKQQLEGQLEKIKEQSGLVKPEEVKRLKLKVARIEQLYSSMRGLREMAEERNRNWETALRYFAAHILKQPADPSAPIGPLVGNALERIGATLVQETEGAEAEALRNHEHDLSIPVEVEAQPASTL